MRTLTATRDSPPSRARSTSRSRGGRWLLLAAVVGLAGCAALRQIAALRQVDFAFGGVADARLAGIDLSRVRSYRDLTAADIVQLTAALARDDLPFEFRIDLRAENPADNKVTARMTRFTWTLLLQDKETVSGVLDQPIELPPGDPRVIPLAVRLDVLDFFSGPAQSLVDIVLAVIGQDAGPQTISLRASPVIDTPVGPITYPTPITIARRTVGAPPGS